MSCDPGSLSGGSMDPKEITCLWNSYGGPLRRRRVSSWPRGLSQSFGVYPALSMRAAYAPPLSESAHDPERPCREAEAPVEGRFQGPPLRSDPDPAGRLLVSALSPELSRH